MKVNKVVLAYSGGLDTSVLVPYLKEKYGCKEVICVYADVGQEEDLEAIRKKALDFGADKIYILDLKEEFAKNYCMPVLWANARYEGKYYLSAAISRPLISKYLVEIAEKEHADAVAHGSTGKGNDQVRFELSVLALNPNLKVLAPVREWEFKSREEEIEYAQKKGIPVFATKKSPYSIDKNLWGISIECGALEDPFNEPPKDAWQITKDPKEVVDEEVILHVFFENALPKAFKVKKGDFIENIKNKLKGKIEEQDNYYLFLYGDNELHKLIMDLNIIAASLGIGRVDMVENRLVGIKSRELYEQPGAEILDKALREIESLILDRESLHFKLSNNQKYADLVYYGYWFSPLKEALDEFNKALLKNATGEVKLKLYKGNIYVLGRKSPYSLYDYKLATYDKEDAFDHIAGGKFTLVWGLPLKQVGKIKKLGGNK